MPAPGLACRDWYFRLGMECEHQKTPGISMLARKGRKGANSQASNCCRDSERYRQRPEIAEIGKIIDSTPGVAGLNITEPFPFW